MICFILQGSKRVAINDHLLSYDSEQYLISALDLPLIGQILDTEDGQPYVAVSLVLDPAILAELAADSRERAKRDWHHHKPDDRFAARHITALIVITRHP